MTMTLRSKFDENSHAQMPCGFSIDTDRALLSLFPRLVYRE